MLHPRDRLHCSSEEGKQLWSSQLTIFDKAKIEKAEAHYDHMRAWADMDSRVSTGWQRRSTNCTRCLPRASARRTDAIKKFPELWPLANVGKLGLTREDLRNGLEPS